MPARPKIPDPQVGPLQAFAYDLRELGAGKAAVSWIAGHQETAVSRAALYAALSGKRLPDRRTVATLLRWWAGDPEAETAGRSAYEDPFWGWIGRLPPDHGGRRVAAEWRTRYDRLVRATVGQRERRTRAKPVTIAMPKEQQAFIDALHELLRKTGLDNALWLLFGERTVRIESYLAGERIPTDAMIFFSVESCRPHIPNGRDVMLDELARLEHLACVARTARVRDRRIARSRRTASTSSGSY